MFRNHPGSSVHRANIGGPAGKVGSAEMDAGFQKDSIIIVGVDGSESSLQALRWAIGLAKLMGAKLEAVMAWEWPNVWGPTPTWPAEVDPAEVTRSQLAQAVDSVLGPGSAPDVQQIVTEGHAASVLITASEHADLLVVGSRGHGTFGGALLGSVSQHCVTHAVCPVVVVRLRSSGKQ